MPLIILFVQTIVFWSLAVILYRFKNRYTLIPLYCYIAIATILTHNLSDLGFGIVTGNWYFFISSFSFFTTLMLGVFLLYLLEGPRAVRLAFWTIIGVSLFYILVVYLLGLLTDTSGWVQLNILTGTTYFWSIFGIIIDIFLLAILWEILAKIKWFPLALRILITSATVLIVDTIIFSTGVFWGTEIYTSMLKGNILIRLILAVLTAIVMTILLKSIGFSEEKRNKPENLFEVLNFKSDLERKIDTMEEMLEKYKKVEKNFQESQETYNLALSGSGAGIWDWNVITNHIKWSPKVYQMLGLEENQLAESLDGFKKILHPDDYEKTFKIVNDCLQNGTPYETEYRLKNSSGQYRWFLASGTVKMDKNNKPIRMVGSLIDIDDRKKAELQLEDKLEELTKLNEAMVGREIKMIELKKEIENLKKLNIKK